MLVLSKTNALRQMISEAIDWTLGKGHGTVIGHNLAVHVYIAHISAKGWPTVLLELERKVSMYP